MKKIQKLQWSSSRKCCLRHVELNTISKGDFLEEIDVDDVVVALVNLPKRVS
ncbi:hypothetical protein IC582_021349 [Cucumis melo]